MIVENDEQARARLGEAVAHLQPRLGKVAALLEDAEDDILGFYAFPEAHWRKLRSTIPLERFNRQIGRRTDVVGIFPHDASLIRLVSTLRVRSKPVMSRASSLAAQPSHARRVAAPPATEPED